MDIIDSILLGLLAYTNLKAVYLVLFNKISAFDPRALFALTVITQMFPQITVIYLNPFYNNEILTALLVVMLLSQIAFNIGFKNGLEKKSVPSIKDFNYSKVKRLLTIFTICGLVPILFYNSLSTVYGGINVILGIFRSLGTFGFIISLIYLERIRSKNRFQLFLYVLAGGVPLFYFSYFVKGSREGMYALILIIFIFLARRKNRKDEKKLSLIFLSTFLVGSFIATSITEIRRVNNYKEAGSQDLNQINYVENFQNSILNKDITNGMDLGNGAILIDKLIQTSQYDLGTGLWNDFIYNFFPSRYFGDDLKKIIYITSLQDPNLAFLENKLTNGITTRTGYYTTFKSFSFFGFIIFYFIGFLLGRFKMKSDASTFYLFIYIACLASIPNMITHSTQYMFYRLELIFIILFPIFRYFVVKIKTPQKTPTKAYEFRDA